MICLLTVGTAAAAGGILLTRTNLDVITENNLRLTEVPEGYVGLYSVEDLVQMAQDVKDGTNARYYILMDDITFTDADYAEDGLCPGGWDPVDLRITEYIKGDLMKDGLPEGYSSGSQSGGDEYIEAEYHRKMEVFNGNGHVIRNLKIRADVTEAFSEKEYGSDSMLHVGLFGDSGPASVRFLHLGMEDCEIIVSGIDPRHADNYVRIGAIAGYAYYVGGCYAKNLTIRADITTTEENRSDGKEILVGGLVGSTAYAEACYVEDYTIDVTCNGLAAYYPHVAPIAGFSTACLTSWDSGGDITVSGNALLDICPEEDEYTPLHHSNVYELRTNIPTFIPAEIFEQLNAAVIEKYGEDSDPYKIIRVCYSNHNAAKATNVYQKETMEVVSGIWNRMHSHYTGDYSTYYDNYYVTLGVTEGEAERIREILLPLFETEEQYNTFCEVTRVKTGNIYCHTFPEGTEVTADTLTGFDFDTIWTMQDGKPRLQIFE